MKAVTLERSLRVAVDASEFTTGVQSYNISPDLEHAVFSDTKKFKSPANGN
jgi:hypothetical protein